jgi:hypothetical protein
LRDLLEELDDVSLADPEKILRSNTVGFDERRAA